MTTKDDQKNTDDAAPLDSDRLARLVASLLLSRKAEDVVILKMDEVLPLTDYSVIATGGNSRHVRALKDVVERGLKGRKILQLNRTPKEAKSWVLLDYGDFVVHLFQPEAREFYDLENLWGDAETVPLTDLPDVPPDDYDPMA
jgi:ribosome-associated protein